MKNKLLSNLLQVMKQEFYSNCFLEMLKAKIRNPQIQVLYIPSFLNEVPCPHWIWLDQNGEHDFCCEESLPFYQWLWHKGSIRTMKRGCYKGYIAKRIEQKYYSARNNK